MLSIRWSADGEKRLRRASGEQVNCWEWFSQNAFGGASEPLAQHAGVDGAEVGRVDQVAIAELVEPRVRSDQSGLDLRAEDEETRGRPVVGSLACVLIDSPAELAKDEHGDAVGKAALGKVCLKRTERFGEGSEQVRVRVGLGGVGVVPILSAIEHANAEVGGKDLAVRRNCVARSPSG